MSSKKSSSSGSSSAGPRSKKAAPTAKSAKAPGRPRIRATHADGSPAGAPAAKRSTKSKKPLSAGELEKRRAHAKASVRALGGARTTTPKRALPPPSKRDLPTNKRTRSVPPPVDRSDPEAAGPSKASKELALALASAGLDKKALGIEVIDVSGRVDYADFLVIMTGTSDRHVHAIAMGLEESLKEKKILPLSVEGLGTATWVLMDFADVVVHVFQEDTRSMYNIEGMWMDASRLDVPDSLDASSPARGPAPN